MLYAKDKLRPKSWDEYSHPESPHMDFIITVYDNAKGETCLTWPGHPATIHWDFPDPALLITQINLNTNRKPPRISTRGFSI